MGSNEDIQSIIHCLCSPVIEIGGRERLITHCRHATGFLTSKYLLPPFGDRAIDQRITTHLDRSIDAIGTEIATLDLSGTAQDRCLKLAGVVNRAYLGIAGALVEYCNGSQTVLRDQSVDDSIPDHLDFAINWHRNYQDLPVPERLAFGMFYYLCLPDGEATAAIVDKKAEWLRSSWNSALGLLTVAYSPSSSKPLAKTASLAGSNAITSAASKAVGDQQASDKNPPN